MNKTLPSLRVVSRQQDAPHRHILKLLPSMEATGSERSSTPAKGAKRGHPRQSPHKHFDINEHLPWMIVLFLLLVLVVIVVCSVRKSSRTLKKGPRQDPSTIVEKAGLKKSLAPAPNREKWIYYCNGHGECPSLFSLSTAPTSLPQSWWPTSGACPECGFLGCCCCCYLVCLSGGNESDHRIRIHACRAGTRIFYFLQQRRQTRVQNPESYLQGLSLTCQLTSEETEFREKLVREARWGWTAPR